MKTPDASEPTLDQQALPEAPTRRRGSQSRAPEFEVALGARIRAARLAARMSQVELGTILDVTLQQVHKYEAGKDRVAASTLQSIAAALGVHPGSFYDDDAPPPAGRASEVRKAMAVAADWQRIRSPQARERLAKLIAEAADESQAEPESED